MRVVDALPAITLLALRPAPNLRCRRTRSRVGDVVRLPLGNREVLGYVVSPARDEAARAAVKRRARRLDVPTAFNDDGLHLARFVAEHYVCTLGKRWRGRPRRCGTAHARVARSDRRYRACQASRHGARAFDRLHLGGVRGTLHLERVAASSRSAAHGGSRHASRARAHARACGSLRRVRDVVDSRTSERRVRILEPAGGTPTGRRPTELSDLVRTNPGLTRAQARLAGFSDGVVARAVRIGAVRERRVRRGRERAGAPPSQLVIPTPEQARALEAVEEALARGRFETTLLYGVTGSGKTLVYVEAIERVLREGGRAIVLVPEISLTPQTAARFEYAFGDRVAVLHSALSERERFEAWDACARGEVDVIVGARSAVFAPLRNVRLVVVDESHDPSYKQDVVPRYNAVAVAAARMRDAQGLLLLGSATPSLESYAAATGGPYRAARDADAPQPRRRPRYRSLTCVRSTRAATERSSAPTWSRRSGSVSNGTKKAFCS